MSPAQPVLIDTSGHPLRMQGTAYNGASRFDAELRSWQPMLRSPDVELLPEWETLVSRTRDMVRNHGLASGAVQSHLDCVIGAGLRLVARPDYRALGLTIEWAEEWERDVQARWRQWAEDVDFYCDAKRRLNFSGLLAQAYRSYLMSSEIFATLEWLPRRRDRYATALNMIQPDRLSNPQDRQDSWRLRGGVEQDNLGAPVAFHIRNAHASDAQFSGAPVWVWTRVPTYTTRGRRQVIHIYDNEQPDQSRGKTPFVSVLAKLRMLDRFEKSSLQAAIINAMYAAVIESSMSDVREAIGESGNSSPLATYTAMQVVNSNKDERAVRFDGAKIPHLLPGEKLSLLAPQHPSAAFEEFERATLRHIAAGLNMSYEQLSRDYSNTNYSSARAAMLEAWRFFSGRRHHIASQFATQVYIAWLEEAIDRGDVVLPPQAPDFYTAKTAWTRCQWIGAPRGQIDELKEMEARTAAYDLGATTLEEICAERGTDWEEITDQRIREIAHIVRKSKEAGLDPQMVLRERRYPSGVSPAKAFASDPEKKAA